MNPPVILVVEDSPDDVFFLQRALRHAHVDAELRVVTNGKEAQDYLAGQGPHSNRRKSPFPWMVLLDLRLPLISGLEVLAWMRARSDLKDLPVIVLTSSLEDSDMRRTFELGVTSYLVKPPTAEMVEKAFRFVRTTHGGELAEGVAVGAHGGDSALSPLATRIVFAVTVLAVILAAGAFIAILLTK
ncbi:MAG TPA: response regulator [Opitutaceae bacterium]|jgi:CheY-like chemotaxis protein|nr:response regulator [Opitutaceae bacterium]